MKQLISFLVLFTVGIIGCYNSDNLPGKSKQEFKRYLDQTINELNTPLLVQY